MTSQEAASDFSQLTYLLQLVTSINSEECLESSFKESACNDDISDPLKFTLLDAITAILVQKDEVVAACYTSDKVSVIAAENDTIPGTDVEIDVPVQSPSSPDSHTFYSLQLAAVSNPEFPQKKYLDTSNRNLHYLRILNGTNLWSEVKKTERGWCFSGPRDLGDHVATLTAYLRDYQSETDQETQRVNSVKFTSYIISTCWPKITRRVSSWQAKGFLMLLNLPVSTNWERIRTFEGYPSTLGPGDQTLIGFLNALQVHNEADEDMVQLVILNHSTYERSDFKQIFERTVTSVTSNTTSPILSKETFLEFHRLTLAAFKGFVYIFMQLKKEIGQLDKKGRSSPTVTNPLSSDQSDVINLLGKASIHYRFLLSIICSYSFKIYYEIIAYSSDRPVFPTRSHKELYKVWFDNYMEKDMGPIEEVADGEVNVDDEADGQLEDEVFYELEGEEGKSSFFRFIKSFVIHLTAKRALERHCFGFKGQPIDISLFAVERPPLCIPAGSWPKMQDVLKQSFLSNWNSSSTSAGETREDTANRAINILEEKVKNPGTQYSPKSQKLLKNFQSIIDGSQVRFPGGLHCETLLATLSKYFESAIKGNNDADLISTCKALLKFSMISVSKLCCPVCWHLLAILGKDSKTPLSVRGSHSVIYPVTLPHWLPDHIVGEMYKSFQTHLGQEINIMLRNDRANSKRNRHAPHESESNISVASTNFAFDLGKYNTTK